MGKDFLIRILGDSSKGISEIDKFAKKADDLTHVGKAGMVMGGLIAAGLGLAVSKYAEFDAAMSNVIASGDDAAANQDALRQAALDAGASTVFSATESANAIEELAKAGVSAADTLSGALTGSLDLAAAGGLGVADAASIMATAMTQFSVEGSQATHVADLLAAGAGKAQGDVSDMAQALGQAGLVANATGLTIEETTGGLAAFASAGLLGSDAGTSFKSMLQRLTPQSAEAQRVMDQLGISAYDAQGNFIGLAEFAGNLQESMRGLTPEARQAAMATIFGSDAVRAATILYNQGSEGIRKWTSDVNDQGYAAETAAKKLDNLQGDLEGLGGAIDTALIQSGSGANDALRELTSRATDIVTWFSELPAPIQQTGFYLGAAAAAIGLFGGGALVAVPKAIEFARAMQSIGVTGANVRSRLGSVVSFLGGPWGVAMLAATAATVAFNAEIQRGVPSQEQIANAAQESASAMDMLRAAAERSGLEKNLWGDYAAQLENLPGLLDRASEAGWRWAELSFNEQGALDSLKRLGDVLGDMAATNLPAASDAYRKLVDQYDLSGEQQAQLLNEMPAFREALLKQATAAGIVADDQALVDLAMGRSTASTEAATKATDTAAGAYLSASEDAAGLTEELDKLVESLNKVNGNGQDAVTANAQWRESLAGISTEVQRQKDEFEKAKGTLDGFSLSLDENTVSGSANAASLANVAKDAQAAAAAQYEVDKTTVGAKAAADNYASTLAAQRQAFVDSATGAGYNADKVQELADKVFALPPERAVQVLAETGVATQRTQDFRNLWESIKNRTVTLTTIGATQIGGGAGAQNGPMLDGYAFGGGKASGGRIVGPGTGTSDSILIAASNGEFVVRESVARENMDLLQHLNDTGKLPAYKGGGLVGLAVASMSAPMAPLAGYGPDSASVVRSSPSNGGSAASSSTVERPIYADGVGLIGWLREVAGEEARLVWANSESQRQQTVRMGRQRNT